MQEESPLVQVQLGPACYCRQGPQVLQPEVKRVAHALRARQGPEGAEKQHRIHQQPFSGFSRALLPANLEGHGLPGGERGLQQGIAQPVQSRRLVRANGTRTFIAVCAGSRPKSTCS